MKFYITHLMQQCGMNPSINGYRYIHDLIDTYYNDYTNEKVPSPIMMLYKNIAEKYNTTISAVERCTRHAVTSATKLRTRMFNNLFDPDVYDSVAVGHFCVSMAEYLYFFCREKTPNEMLNDGWCLSCSANAYNCNKNGRCEGYEVT